MNTFIPTLLWRWIEVYGMHMTVELLLLLSLVWLFFSNRYRRSDRNDPLSLKEEEQLIAEWQPEPLCKPLTRPLRQQPAVDGPLTTHVQIDGKDVVNVATFNYLGLVKDKRIEEIAISSVQKYGVGSCGPRGFYGTIDVHLLLEEALAKFLGAEETILYSYGFSTVASAIPAYSKRGDILYVDEAACFPIQKGVIASRSKIVFFRHNDMEDLENKLKEQQAEDVKDKAKAMATRRFIVVEGLYLNTGSVCPLPKLVELKYKYKTRLIIEESHSFGVLGEQGRGVTEHFGVKIEDVDIITASMGGALSSVGGFCAGRSYVIDHQRLSGQGYCYSASLPPLLANAALVTLDVLKSNEGRERLETLRSNSKYLRNAVSKLRNIEVRSDQLSPLIHVHLAKEVVNERNIGNDVIKQESLLHDIANAAITKGAAFAPAYYIWEEELKPRRPSLRLAVSASHTKEDLDKAVSALQFGLEAVNL